MPNMQAIADEADRICARRVDELCDNGTVPELFTAITALVGSVRGEAPGRVFMRNDILVIDLTRGGPAEMLRRAQVHR